MVESIKELKKLCDKGEREHWYVRRVMRPSSMYFTRLFLVWRISANQVTFFAMSLSIIAGILFAIGGYVYSIVAALLFNVWLFFDVIDGQIARYHGRLTPFGAVLDSIDADISYAVLFISAGIGVYHMPFTTQFYVSTPVYTWLQSFDPAIFIIFGAIASLTKILGRHVENKFALISNAGTGSDLKETGNGASVIERLRTVARKVDFNLFNQGGLLLLLVLTAAVLDLLPLWVILCGVCLPVLFMAKLVIRVRSYL